MAESPQVLSSRLLILLLALASVFLLFSSRVQADQPVALGERVVVAGDTLWAIAEDVTEQGGDVRATLAHLKDLNDLEGALIQPGQRLLVPLL